jgi:lipoprotein-releasing system permease protein
VRLANRLSVGPGDIVTLVPPTATAVNPALGIAMPRFWRFEVTGLFDTGMFQYDNKFVVMSREVAQSFTGLGDAVSAIEVRVTDPWLAPEVGERLESRLGYPYRALDWQAQNASLFSALELEKLAMGLVIFFIMVVAAFNIVGTLTMVLLQGAIIGAVGTVLGLIGGLAVAYVVDRSGWIRINPQIYFIDRLPIDVELRDVAIVAAASFAVAVIATIYPSRTASRLAPVEAIRHE